jgi:hypothetical protein
MLVDRLSNPTADMVDALVFLQGQGVHLKELGELIAVPSSDSVCLDGICSSRSLLLLAESYCIMFHYRCQGGKSASSSSEPTDPAGFHSAFSAALQRPPTFLQDLLTLRAQVVPNERSSRAWPLCRDTEASHDAFRTNRPLAEVLRQLSVYIRGAVECAQIYHEIREATKLKQFSEEQAAQLLDGPDSDQSRMMGAMGVCRQEETLQQCVEVDGYKATAVVSVADGDGQRQPLIDRPCQPGSGYVMERGCDDEDDD